MATTLQSHALNDDQIARYERDGFVTPINVFSPEETQRMRAAFQDYEESIGQERAAVERGDLHLLQRWAWDAVNDRRVVDPVVSVLGPNVLLWSMNWFVKEPGLAKFVSMHQDANYWGLEPHDVVTAWIALSDASEATGPMRFLPGTHRGELHEHENTYAPDNLLSRGQTARSGLDESTAQLAPLDEGQMSLHHVRLLHGSDPNTTDDRRIGMVLRFCATHVRQTKALDSAVLVAGEDRFGHFELLPGPKTDSDPEAARRHRRSARNMGRIIHSD